MFKLLKFSMRLILSVVILITSPLVFLIATIHANSFREAFDDTVDIITSPFDEI